MTPSDLPTTATQASPPLRMSAGRFFANHRRAARLWMGAFLVSVALNHLQWFIPRNSDPEWIVIMDTAGNVIRSKPTRFKSSASLQGRHARLAAQALLNRSPGGFDDPELLGLLFLPDALTKAQIDVEVEKRERSEKQLHQKAEIGAIEVLETRDDRVLLHLTGQVVRSGSFRGNTFSESIPFRLHLTMIRNPDMSRNDRFYLAVSEYAYETTR